MIEFWYTMKGKKKKKLKKKKVKDQSLNWKSQDRII